MNLSTKKVILTVLSILLAAEIGAVCILGSSDSTTAPEPTVPAATAGAAEVMEAISTDAATAPAETAAPTETMAPTTPPVTEPKEQRYILSFAGDCTLGSISKNWNNANHFIQTIGDDYDYPFDNVRKYFENDDFTIINLEGPLTDSSSGAQSKTFAFRGPTAYTRIMTGSFVEAVTLANNHAEDYGKAGYESTTKALKEAGITYVEKNKTAMYTTQRGLKIGLYAAAFDFNTAAMKNEIAALRKNGAEIIICAFHWGDEGVYRADANQQKVAKAAIDAGADIVYGHHPHVLQKIEQYNGGYIFYSLGNFSFGGAALPGDYDTALLQLDVIRDEKGKVSLGELTIIPCSISSVSGQNNFQPTPLEEGKAYDRVLSKLDGSFKGANLNVDYSKLDPKPETPDTDDTPSGGGESSGSDSSSGSGESSGGSSSGGGESSGGSSSGGGESSGGSSSGSGESSGGSSSGSGESSGSSSSGGGESSGGSSSGGGESSGGSSSGGGESSGGSSSGGGESSGGSSSGGSSSGSGSSGGDSAPAPAPAPETPAPAPAPAPETPAPAPAPESPAPEA